MSDIPERQLNQTPEEVHVDKDSDSRNASQRPIVDFESARQIVAAYIESKNDYVVVAPWGWHSQEWWSLMVGLPEYIIEFNSAYAIVDDIVYLVHKDTGVFVMEHAPIFLQSAEPFLPYGDVPDYFLED
jgi:hypothetical protein